MDKNTIATILFMLLILTALFFAYILGIQKSFQRDTAPSPNHASTLKTQEQKIIDDTEQQRKKAMEDLQQRIRDQRQRY